MTNKQAKRLCLKIWRYLRDNPEIYNKFQLPKKLWDKIKDLRGKCPLCEVVICDYCPLLLLTDDNNDFKCKHYYKWDRAKTNKKRAEYAGRIVEIVEKWELRGEE